MWPRGKRKKPLDVQQFILSLSQEVSLRQIAKLAGVSDRTVRRWAGGANTDVETVTGLIDKLFPLYKHALPIYRPDMALDGDTRVGGVGEYTRMSAQGRRSCLA